MDAKVASYFAEQLREARAAVLKDSEQFGQLLIAFERLGSFLLGRQANLGEYRGPLKEVAARSPLFERDAELRPFHTPFDALYKIVRTGRNGAMHEGAYARNLAEHAVQLAILIEDGLKEMMTTISDLMVRTPVTAEPWQPISFVRQAMLANSFSYLPFRDTRDGKWSLLSDLDVARFIKVGEAGSVRSRLSMKVAIALERGLALTPAAVLDPGDNVSTAILRLNGRAGVVVDDSGNLLGIVTAFDLL